MAIVLQPSLFSWADLEARSDLDRLGLALENLPDQQIVRYLEVMRGNGRDDFPVAPMWNALLAGVVFQHVSIESLCRELSRNPALLERCGFDPLPRQRKPAPRIEADARGQANVVYLPSALAETAAPKPHNFSRFLRNVIELEECLGLISGLLRPLREALMELLPDFGKHQGYDGKGIDSHSTGQRDRATGQTSDPDADWGKHETHGVDANGKAWSKIKSWFGYSVHLIADTHYELPLAFEVAPASHGESPMLRRMIRELFAETPELAERGATFSADRGLDCAETKAMLWDDYAIRPLIDIRRMWRAEKEEPGYDPKQPITRPLFPDRVDTIVHTEQGSVHCICPKTGIQRDLAFHGFEADRDTLKYRCPAAVYGLECQGREQCHQAGGVQPRDYGRIIRIPLAEHDRRIFTPTPHGSPSWQRGYNRRSALERINNRIDHSFCFEDHYIRGKVKMTVRVGLALAVMLAMAVGHVKAGRLDQVRSLVRSIPATG